MNFDEFPPSEVLNRAEELSNAGEFAEALTMFEHYHATALSKDPSQVGVRSSFALAYWNELAAKYPPAMESFLRKREAAMELALKEPRNVTAFLEAVGFELALKNSDAIVRLFKFCIDKHPDLAEKYVGMVSHWLIESGELELFCRCGGDLISEFKAHRNRILNTLSRFQTMLDSKRFEAIRVRMFEPIRDWGNRFMDFFHAHEDAARIAELNALLDNLAATEVKKESDGN